jgi:hypothetical protein
VLQFSKLTFWEWRFMQFGDSWGNHEYPLQFLILLLVFSSQSYCSHHGALFYLESLAPLQFLPFIECPHRPTPHFANSLLPAVFLSNSSQDIPSVSRLPARAMQFYVILSLLLSFIAIVTAIPRASNDGLLAANVMERDAPHKG